MSNKERIYVRYADGGTAMEEECIGYERVAASVATAPFSDTGVPRTLEGVLEECCRRFALEENNEDDDEGETTFALFVYRPQRQRFYRVRNLADVKDEDECELRVVSDTEAATASGSGGTGSSGACRIKGSKNSGTNKSPQNRSSISSSGSSKKKKVIPTKMKKEKQPVKKEKTPVKKKINPKKSEPRSRPSLEAPIFLGTVRSTSSRKRMPVDRYGAIYNSGANDDNDRDAEISYSPSVKTTGRKTQRGIKQDDSDVADEPTRDEMKIISILCKDENWDEVLQRVKSDNRLALIPFKLGNGHAGTILQQAILGSSETTARYRVMKFILDTCPAAASIAFQSGTLSLHAILNRRVTMEKTAKEELIRKLVQINPQALLHQGSQEARTPLHVAVMATTSQDIMQYLIQQGRQACFIKDRKGLLPVHLACQGRGSISTVQALLKVNPNALWDRTDTGKNLLQFVKGLSHRRPQLESFLKQQMNDEDDSMDSQNYVDGEMTDERDLLIAGGRRRDHAPPTAGRTKKTSNLTVGTYRRLFNYPVGTQLAVEIYPGFFYEGKITKIHLGWVRLNFQHANGKNLTYDLRTYRHWVISDGGARDRICERTEHDSGDTKDDFVMVEQVDGEQVEDGGVKMSVFTRKSPSVDRRQPPEVGDRVTVQWKTGPSETVVYYDGTVTDSRWVRVKGTRLNFVHVLYDETDERAWSVSSASINLGGDQEDTSTSTSRSRSNTVSASGSPLQRDPSEGVSSSVAMGNSNGAATYFDDEGVPSRSPASLNDLAFQRDHVRTESELSHVVYL